ncbi:MAG: winged helix DNA-binding domain-containing protein [Planctomycetes bacterium]|nr:winged helix DNA-binding domain-containing protein [Planctomycetota bacterium]
MTNIDKRELLLASLDKQFFLSRGRSRDIVSRLCGLQAQFANNPGHALRIRASDFHPSTWTEGLVKTWTFRHTLHAVRRDELSLFLSAVGIPKKWDDGWMLDPKIKPKMSSRLLGWIREGVTEREALKKKALAIGTKPEVMEGVFHGWGGLLSEMCRRGLIAYAPDTGKRFVPLDDFKPMPMAKARAILLERYFRHLGPATIQDAAWFFRLPQKTIRAAIEKAAMPLRTVNVDGTPYFYIGEYDRSRDIPPCLFLSGFDQLLLAYRDRTRLQDDCHKPLVVTNTGIIHPTILLDGRLRARWKKDGRVLRIFPFKTLTKKARRLIELKGGELFGEEIGSVEFA